jgi:hypothetical protein
MLTQVHRVHDLPKDKVIIHFLPKRELDKEGIKAKFDSDDKKFYVSPSGTSFHHEFGHYMDRFVFGQKGKPWSEADPGYYNKFGFKKRKYGRKYTQYYDPIRKFRGWYTPRRDDDDETTAEYARSMPKEHFASAYNKLVGRERDGSYHHVNDDDLNKFQKLLFNKLREANIKVKKLAAAQ